MRAYLMREGTQSMISLSEVVIAADTSNLIEIFTFRERKIQLAQIESYYFIFDKLSISSSR